MHNTGRRLESGSPISNLVPLLEGFPGGSVAKNPPATHAFDLWVGKISWRRKCIPVFLTGKSHGQRILVSYSSWGCRVRHDLGTKQRRLLGPPIMLGPHRANQFISLSANLVNDLSSTFSCQSLSNSLKYCYLLPR